MEGRCILMEIIKGKLSKPQKTVIYGPEGVGKSTFASQFPDPLFIDTEGSTVNLDVARLPIPSSWTMLLAQVDYVIKNPDVCRTLVMDTADWSERLCAEHITAKAGVDGIEGFGWGKGYTYLEEEFGRLLNKLQDVISVGIHVVITAHAEIKKIEQPEEVGGYDHWQLKLEKKTMPLLKEWADMLLFANYKVHIVNVDNQGVQKGKNKAQGGKRVMYTTHTPWWDAKNRHGLADELPFEYGAIAHCIPNIASATKPNKPAAPAAPVQEVKPVPDNVYGKTTYWKADNGFVFIAKPGEPVSKDLTEIDFDQYKKLKADSEAKVTEDKKAKEAKETPESPKDDMSGLPKSLTDLMVANSVTIAEIQKAVASRGYYPKDTPVANYDPQFIAGVLVGAWGQVYQMILDGRADEPY